jgi:hypothetical protein
MSDTLDWNVAMIGKGHDLTQLIYADAIIDARQSGGLDPVRVTNISRLPADGKF